MNVELGFKLKNLRKNFNLSGNDVKKKLKKQNLDYSLQSIYKWEEGASMPKLNVLMSLAKIYKCDISYLLNEKNLTYQNLTNGEIFLLDSYRNNFLFRSIAVQIMRL